MTKVQNLSTLLSVYIIYGCFQQISCFNCHQYECTQDRPYCWTDGCHEKCPRNTVPTGLAPDSDFVVNCAIKCKPPKIEYQNRCVDRNECPLYAIFEGRCLKSCPKGYLLSESGDKSCFSAWDNYRKLIIVGSLIFCIIVAMAIFLSTKKFDLSFCKMATNNRVCNICYKEFSKVYNLTRHLRVVHANLKHYECQHCKVTFGYSWTLRQHQSKVHGEGQSFTCSKCQRVFHHRGNFKEHQEACNTGKERIQCDACSKSFKTHASLRDHKRNFHSEADQPKEVCELCGKQFKRKQDLRRHMKSKIHRDD